MSAVLAEPIDLIPKKYIQQEKFLQKYPEFDGRGILIAIIDSGIDVSLDGKQKTSTGLPKIIDCFDFSGAGKVDTSTVRKTGKERSLKLLSGKEVKIPKKWKNPSNLWHLGSKSWKDISPQIVTKIDDPDEENEEAEKSFDTNKNKSLNPEETNENILPEHKNDTIDCIVWNDGKKWYTCIISPSCKNLENSKVLTNFRDEHEYCFLSENVSCCVTIKNDGNLLEMFCPYQEHGSKVAQVAAAHYPGQPEKDGLAPGAQIVSINFKNIFKTKKVNVKGLEKAFNKCIELGVDIINVSVIIDAVTRRAISTLRKKMVHEHGIIITTAAGNYGPFISSLRCDTNNFYDEMFTIGSIFTSDMKSIVGEKDDNTPPHLWDSSSKGPLPNGGRGVNFVAPGGAVLENPRWHPTKKRFCCGTSFASPNAAGAIACLLTGLKANSIKYNPAMMKIVLSNTAILPDGGDRLGFGDGIIQMSSAFEYCKTAKMDILQKIIFPQICIKKSNKKGIVFYKLWNDNTVKEYCIEIENKQKRIPWILKLVPEKNQNHIAFSKTVANNLFHVKIDAKELKPGNYYYSEIHGFDPSNFSIGPLFRFPITVIVPEKVVNNCFEREISVTPPSVFNLFLDPSKSCNKCTVKLQNPENGEIQFQKTIVKAEYCNIYKLYEAYHTKDFIFRQTGYLWMVKFRWEKVFEIYIHSQIFVGKDCDLKLYLKLDFEE